MNADEMQLAYMAKQIAAGLVDPDDLRAFASHPTGGEHAVFAAGLAHFTVMLAKAIIDEAHERAKEGTS